MTRYSDEVRPCRCGSGLNSRWFKDGHGIELFRGCDKCGPQKLKEFRPDILEHYQAEEPIEPDDPRPRAGELWEVGNPDDTE